MDGFPNFKSLLKAKLFEFYQIYCQCNLIIVFEVHFSWLFSNKAFKACFGVRKIQLLFFYFDPYY